MFRNRLRKELDLLMREPCPGISVWVGDDGSNMNILEASVEGPDESPYEDGSFLLSIRVPTGYPMEPPMVQFMTPIFHPNIDSDGRICLDTLKTPPAGTWSPASSLHTVLLSIRLLMGHPNAMDGLSPAATELYLKNVMQFRATAMQHTRAHAIRRGQPTTGEGGETSNSSSSSSSSSNDSNCSSTNDSSSDITSDVGTAKAAATLDEWSAMGGVAVEAAATFARKEHEAVAGTAAAAAAATRADAAGSGRKRRRLTGDSGHGESSGSTVGAALGIKEDATDAEAVEQAWRRGRWGGDSPGARVVLGRGGSFSIRVAAAPALVMEASMAGSAR